ncbi:MAG: L-threonylcarbamoyladenylate synthase [Gemmobacter sp.]
MTDTLGTMPQDLHRAADLLRRGLLVAFPTETVYGLGGDAASDAAVAAIYAAKGRPSFNPLIVHVADAAAAHRLAVFAPVAATLAAAFWPGPLTLVLPLRHGHGLSARVTAGLPKVALRVPAHPVAQGLLHAFGGPLAAPSANPSGRVSPTRAAHVLDGLAGRIAAVVDGGPCAVGVESTILGLDDAGLVHLLRPGGLAVEEVEAVTGTPVSTMADPARPLAPGQLASHYAPAAALRLNASGPEPGEVWIGFGTGGALDLSPSRDLAQAAAALFHALRQADRIAGPGGRIAVAPVPDTGLGRAINDRLRRAAAPRE